MIKKATTLLSIILSLVGLTSSVSAEMPNTAKAQQLPTKNEMIV